MGLVLAFVSSLLLVLLVSFCSSFSVPLSPWVLLKAKQVLEKQLFLWLGLDFWRIDGTKSFCLGPS